MVMPVGKNVLYAIESLKTNQINKLIVLMSIKWSCGLKLQV